jgi:hypothetical protein
LKLAGFCVVDWVLPGNDVVVLVLLLTALAMLPASAGTAAATAELIAAVCEGTTDAAAPAIVEASPGLPASAAAVAAAAMTPAKFAGGTLDAMAVARAVANALAFGKPAMALATALAIAPALAGLALMAEATASETCWGVALAMVTPSGKEMGSAESALGGRGAVGGAGAAGTVDGGRGRVWAEATWGAISKARATIMIFIVWVSNWMLCI